MKNKTIWIDHKAMWKPDIYTFRNCMVTYYIEEYRLFAQVWKQDHPFPTESLHLVRTVEILEHENKSMKELING